MSILRTRSNCARLTKGSPPERVGVILAHSRQISDFTECAQARGCHYDERNPSSAEIMDTFTELISEPIRVSESEFDPAGMAAGSPGIPTSFEWRNQTYEVVRVEEEWRKINSEGYVRRHYFRVLTRDGSRFEIYCERKARSARQQKMRWWIYRRGRGNQEQFSA